MRVGILGSGTVGTALGDLFIQAGHEVRFGVREPASKSAGHDWCDLVEAAAFGEVCVLAVPFPVVDAVLRSLDVVDLSGKVLVDVTNPVTWKDGPVIAETPAPSGAETIQILTTAHVVKAFNTFGSEYHTSATIGGVPVDVPIAGNDADARAKVAELTSSAGYRPLDCGPLHNARLLEHLAVLWIYLATKGGHGRNVAWKLISE